MIGFDSHPDSFTAAMLRGQTPAQAVIERVYNQLPMAQLRSWAQKNTTPLDLIVLEASGNSFHVVRILEALGRRALVLESTHLGKLKEAHANTDKISAVRIAKGYLAGTARIVWVPDSKSQERRDGFHAYQKSVKRCTQVTNRLLSFLSDNGVRLPGNGRDLPGDTAAEVLRGLHDWPASQWRVIEGLLLDRRHAEEQRAHWQRGIAQEVIADPLLLSLVRLCGIRDTIAFALGAIIGDIRRFAEPAKLVKYFGLNPAFDSSGEGEWRGGIGGHGRSDIRALLIEAAQSILRSDNALAAWGKKLMGRKGSKNLAVAAIARKLTVSVWYLMMGRWKPVEEIDDALSLKIGKIVSKASAGEPKPARAAHKRLREQVEKSLLTGRIYHLDPKKRLEPKAPAAGPSKAPVEPDNPCFEALAVAAGVG